MHLSEEIGCVDACRGDCLAVCGNLILMSGGPVWVLFCRR